MAGAVSGREDDVDVKPGQLEVLPADEQLVGVVALEAGEPEPAHRGVDVGEDVALERRAVDRRSRCVRERGHRADVVDVRVRDQDRLDPRAQRADLRDQALGLIARVDQHGSVGARAGNQVAVLGERPDRETANFERFHQRGDLRRCCRRYMNWSV